MTRHLPVSTLSTGVTPGVAPSVGLDKHVMTRVHRHSVTGPRIACHPCAPRAPSSPLETSDRLTVYLVLPFLERRIAGVTRHAAFQIGFLHLVLGI